MSNTAKANTCRQCYNQFCPLHIASHKVGWDQCGSITNIKTNECHYCLLERKITKLEERLEKLEKLK